MLSRNLSHRSSTRNVVSARVAGHLTHGVKQYGVVRSFTRPDRINHGVVKVGRSFSLLKTFCIATSIAVHANTYAPSRKSWRRKEDADVQ